jgi:tRNA pseudouridine38-40 synthase
MACFKLTLSYEGTDFVGWQRQASGRSVQALVEEALSQIEGAPLAVVAAGRTDAGVHALGQVASVSLQRRVGASALRRALNANLPPDVRVVAVEPAPPDFNARFAAQAKTYRYRIICGEFISPFDRRFAWHMPVPLDVAEMRRAAAHLEGHHDFAAFQSAGSDVTTTGRTLLKSVLTSEKKTESDELVYEVTGDGFLRHMVRAIVGTLVEIGAGRLEADDLEAILASRDRHRAGPTAPAHGLCLVAVSFGNFTQTRSQLEPAPDEPA